MSGAATSQTAPEQAGSGRPSRGHTRAASYTHSPYEPVTTPTPGDEDSSENKVQQQQQQGGAPQRFSGHQRSASQQSSSTPNASFSGRGMRGGPSNATGTEISPSKPNPSLMGKSWYDYTDSPDKAGGGQSSSPGGFEGSSPPGRGGAAGGSGHIRGESGASHSYDSEIGVVMHGGIGGSAAATGGPGRSGSNSRPAGHSRTTSTNSTSFTHSPYGSGGGAASHSRQGSLQYNQNPQNQQQQQQELSDANSPLGGSQHHQESFVPQVTVVPRRGHGRTESTQSHTSVVSLDEANSSLRIFGRGAGHSRQASRDDGGTSSPPQGLHHQRQSSYQPMTVTSSNDPVGSGGPAGTGDPSPHYLPTVVGPALLQRMNTDAYDSGIHNPSHPNFPAADPRHHHHHAAVDNNPQQHQYQQQQHSTSYSPASMQLVTDQQQQYQQQQPAEGYYGGTGGFSGDPTGAASASSSFYGGHTAYTTGSEASGGGGGGIRIGHRPAGHQPTFSQVSMISSTASPLHPNSSSNVADFGGGSSLTGEVQTPTIRVGGPVVKVKGRLVDPPSSLNQSFNPEKSWRTAEEQQEGRISSTIDKTSPTPTTSADEKNKKISSVKSPGGRSLPPQSPNSTLPTGGGDFARVSPTTRHAAAKSAMATPSAIAGGGKPTHLMIARAAAAKAAGENSSSSATTGGKSQHRKTQSSQSKDSNTSGPEVKEPMTPTPGMSMASFHRRQMSATAVVPGSSSVGNSLTRSTPHGGESSAFDNANNNNGSSSMGSPQLTIGGSSTVGSGGAMMLDAEAFARRPESDYSGGYGAMHSRNHSMYENQSPAGSPNAMMVNTFPTGSQHQQQHSTSQHQTPGGGVASEAGGTFHSFPHTPSLQGGAAGLVQNGIVMSAHSRCSSSTNITDATTNASQYPMRSKNLFHRKLKGKMEYIPYPSKEYLLQEMRRHQLRQQKEASATAELEKKKNEAAAATASSSSKSETADTKEEEKASRGGIGDGAASSPPRSGGGATTAASPSPILGQPYKGEPTEFGCFFGQVKFESTIELMAWLIRALTTPEVSAPGRIPASQQTSSHRGSSRPSEASMSEAGLSSPPMPSSIKMDKRSSAGVDSSSVVTNGSIAENSSSLQAEETLPYVAGGGGASGSNKAQPSPPVPEDDQASTVVVQQDSQSAASCSSSSALPAIDISYMHPRGNGCWMAYFASLEDWERVMEFNSRVLWDEHGVWVARTPTECEVLKAYISKIGRPPKGVRLPKEPMIIRK